MAAGATTQLLGITPDPAPGTLATEVFEDRPGQVGGKNSGCGSGPLPQIQSAVNPCDFPVTRSAILGGGRDVGLKIYETPVCSCYRDTRRRFDCFLWCHIGLVVGDWIFVSGPEVSSAAVRKATMIPPVNGIAAQVNPPAVILSFRIISSPLHIWTQISSLWLVSTAFFWHDRSARSGELQISHKCIKFGAAIFWAVTIFHNTGCLIRG